MKSLLLSGLLLAGVAAAAAPAGAEVVGEYVEARSLSVQAGPCHYNGEVTTSGREAVLAWKVDSGVLDGVRVDGLGVVAVVAGAGNLADAKTPRRSVLYVSEKATPAQRDALLRQIRAGAAAALGTVVAVKSVPQTLSFGDKTVRVLAGDDVRLSVSRYPCGHCTQPGQTWYKPLTSVNDAAVAQGVATGFKNAALGISWSQEASDNVFLGTFAF
uniref:DUF1326 domain-containing protein n=2 Tax=uncultured Armatimonadetes bacterium TaxID=157466 RepID=A0A6J4JFL4_9BACT|nr:hypothetical protein AVDCRST_MAG63-3430 [uncultured Armatimonadetes bacterium]